MKESARRRSPSCAARLDASSGIDERAALAPRRCTSTCRPARSPRTARRRASTIATALVSLATGHPRARRRRHDRRGDAARARAAGRRRAREGRWRRCAPGITHRDPARARTWPICEEIPRRARAPDRLHRASTDMDEVLEAALGAQPPRRQAPDQGTDAPPRAPPAGVAAAKGGDDGCRSEAAPTPGCATVPRRAADIGEFGLIERIERMASRLSKPPGSSLGIGDDAALLRPRARRGRRGHHRRVRRGRPLPLRSGVARDGRPPRHGGARSRTSPPWVRGRSASPAPWPWRRTRCSTRC